MTQIVDFTKKGQRRHPCFEQGAHKYARIHLPVAPACNIKCNYCSRKYDCQNESRPGVTSGILTPGEALSRFREVKAQMPNLMVAGIAGPGDALCDFAKTKETVQLIKKEDPGIALCISTNGLLLPKYAFEISSLGIEYVTVTINAVDVDIASRIYGFVQWEGKILSGRDAAALLIQHQLEGLRMLAKNDVIVKVNTVLIKDVNSEHVEKVVKTARDLGAYISNIMPLIPTPGTLFENHPAMGHEEIHRVRENCETYLPQMRHCRQCRADAVGMLAEDRSVEFRNMGCRAEPLTKKDTKEMIV